MDEVQGADPAAQPDHQALLPDAPDDGANPFFCMRLAAAVGLPVAEVLLRPQACGPAILETRQPDIPFDGLLPSPPIDGCTALGLPASLRYERSYAGGRSNRLSRAGASLPRLFGLLQGAARPAAQRLTLLRWVIFQVLIGNTDAHAGSLSFHLIGGKLILAPVQGLRCCLLDRAAALDPPSFAMAIGDAFRPAELNSYEWAHFSRASGLSPVLVSRELSRLSRLALKHLEGVRQQALADGARAEVLAAVAAQVRSEAARQLGLAADMIFMARSRL